MGHTKQPDQTNFTLGEWRAWQLAPDSDPQERSIVVAGPDGNIEVCGIVNNPADVPLIAAAKELFVELGDMRCIECDHPLRLHVDKHGCEQERGDGYRPGSEILEALGPCACTGYASDKKAIAVLRKAKGE